MPVANHDRGEGPSRTNKPPWEHSVLEQPFKLDRATVRISASIGIASRTSCTSRTLLHVADRAMYEAEGVGTGHIVTSPQYVVSSSWL